MSSAVDHLTFRIGDQLFGAPIQDVRDVYPLADMTPVPLSGDEVAGLLNLRGSIVTAVDARSRLGMPPRQANSAVMVIGVERDAENYGLIIDKAESVISLDLSSFHTNPVNLNPVWASISKGVCRLEDDLLVVLDIDKMLFLHHSGDSEAA